MPSAKMPSTRWQSSQLDSTKSRRESAAGLAGVRVTAEEADAILFELANNDDDAKKTWSRTFVEKFLSKVRSS
jgi:hypothetical protein